MKQASLYKGILQPIIMQLLKDNGEMYGFEITQKVKSLTNEQVKITEGALYPLLHKLEADGLLTTKVKHHGNRMRKYYSLTASGKKQTTSSVDEIQNFIANLQILFNLKPA